MKTFEKLRQVLSLQKQSVCEIDKRPENECRDVAVLRLLGSGNA